MDLGEKSAQGPSRVSRDETVVGRRPLGSIGWATWLVQMMAIPESLDSGRLSMALL